MSEIDELKRKVCTFALMQNDCETIKAIGLQHREPVFNMFFIPYLALFCRSIQEYFRETLIEPQTDAEIYDIRNTFKQYCDRYGKNRKRFLEIDEQQDEEFRKMLRFAFMRRLNLHYNLGVYFDNARHVIGNTQLVENYLKMHGLSENEKGKKVYSLACSLGRVIGSVSSDFSKILIAPTIQINDKIPTIHYCDINSNKCRFFNPRYGKDINLFLLHILSNLGYIKYYLECLIPNNNPWMFRIKYITTYYSFQGLKKLNSHLENIIFAKNGELLREIREIIDEGTPLFVSKFRNCMMHYDLADHEQFAISDDCFDGRKPLFGLVEDCFEGKTFAQYSSSIYSLADRIEAFTSSHFDFSNAQINPL